MGGSKFISGEGLNDEVLGYYRNLIDHAEVIHPHAAPEHTLDFILDGNGFEAMYLDGELLMSLYTLHAHEVAMLLAEHLRLPWKITFGSDYDNA